MDRPWSFPDQGLHRVPGFIHNISTSSRLTAKACLVQIIFASSTHKLAKCVDEPHTCPLPGPHPYLRPLAIGACTPHLLQLVMAGASFGYVAACAVCAGCEPAGPILHPDGYALMPDQNNGWTSHGMARRMTTSGL